MSRKTNKQNDSLNAIAALLAFFFPGLGHIIKGKIGKALLIWLAEGLLIIAFFAVFIFMGTSIFTLVGSPDFPINLIQQGVAFMVFFLFWCLAEFGLWVWNIYDAYKS